MLVDRMMRAARLDNTLYEEVERDVSATTQALQVVIIVALASGISNGISLSLAGRPGMAITGLIGGIISGLLGWVVWSFLSYWIGTGVFNGTATPAELLRTIGFAYSPNVLQIVGFIPCIGPLIVFVAAIWSLVAGVVAVRQALDFDTTKAILTVVLGWFAMLVIIALLGLLGFGAFSLGRAF